MHSYDIVHLSDAGKQLLFLAGLEITYIGATSQQSMVICRIRETEPLSIYRAYNNLEETSIKHLKLQVGADSICFTCIWATLAFDLDAHVQSTSACLLSFLEFISAAGTSISNEGDQIMGASRQILLKPGL